MSNPMSAAAPPNQMQSGGVRRVNNLPIYLIGVAVVIFLSIMALVAMDRTHTKQANADTVKRNGNTTLFAKELAGDRKDGIIAASMPYQEENDFRPVNPNLPPMPPMAPQTQQPSQYQADAERIRQLKLQQFEEALKAKTSVQLP